ncbi:MAG TPA: hypothetical protein VME66_10035 [Candidatus Acidoferrales bacterium]|nr:hypothetical protein [Candidatus Acidoferrales bacterium]
MLTGVRFAIAFAFAVIAPSAAAGAGTPLHHVWSLHAASVVARPATTRTVTQRAPQFFPAHASAASLKTLKTPDHAASAPPVYNPLVRRHMAMTPVTVGALER